MLKRVWRLFGKPDPAAVAASIPTVTVRADDNDDSAASAAFVMPFEIRPIEPADGDALRQLFRQSVEQIGSKYYDAAATAAWARSADDVEFVSRLQRGGVFETMPRYNAVIGVGGGDDDGGIIDAGFDVVIGRIGQLHF